MKTTKILLSLVLLASVATAALAKNSDTSTEEQRRTTKRVVHILSEQWGVDPQKVSGASYFLREFGADSLDIMELVMALEEEFDIEIFDEEWREITTIDSAVELILDKQKRWYRRY